jgi:hypothetical protein
VFCGKNTVSQVVRSILGSFAKLRKATVRFVMSVCPRGRTRGSHWTDFDEILFLSVWKIRVLLKCEENEGKL